MPAQCLKALKKLVPIGTGDASTGTWTKVLNAGIPYLSKTTVAQATRVSFPLQIESVDGELGAQLLKIEFPVRIATANIPLTPSVIVYRRANVAVAGAGTNIVASVIAGTLTGGTTTAAATDRLLTYTITTPGFDYTAQPKATYHADLIIKTTTNTQLRVYEPIVYYNLPS